MNIIAQFIDKGNKELQEDRILKINNNHFFLISIIDGHGSKYKDDIIKYLENNFKKKFIQYFKNTSFSIESIKKFFLILDKMVRKENINSGACFVGILLDKKTNLLYVINIGDSYIKLYNKNTLQLIYQNKLHNLNNITELNRIKRYNKERYIINNRYKGLLVTRTIGDHNCKNDKEEPLIALPDINIFNNDDYLILLYSDGFLLNYDIKYLINNYKSVYLKEYLQTISYKNNHTYKIIDNVSFVMLETITMNTVIYNILSEFCEL